MFSDRRLPDDQNIGFELSALSYELIRFPLKFLLPERRQLAQALDNGRHLFDHEIDFLGRGVPAEAIADRAVGRCERDTHGTQYVGGLQRAGGAGRARGCADAMLVHQQQDGLALHVFKGDTGGIR